MKREGISKKTRFEVFKRDKFTCQYCGRAAPDVILVIDHINPVANGGETEIINLITACKDCNAGKAARTLSDDAVVKKQKKQLDELQERREQLEAMSEWHSSLVGIADQEAEACSDYLALLTGNTYCLSEQGKSNIKKHRKKYSMVEIFEAMRAAAEQYIEKIDGKVTQESVNIALGMVPRICSSKRRDQIKPYLKDLYYIRGIIRKRMFCNDWRAMKILETAYNTGANIEDLKQIAIDAPNWSTWTATMSKTYGAEA